jgi:hypothetical protein
MAPRAFLEHVVRPNADEFTSNVDKLRHAYNAVFTVDALAAHLYVWCLANATSEVAGIEDDTLYRANLARRNKSFSLLRDIAKAQKHVSLTRGNPQVTDAAQISARSIGWGEGGYGEGRYGSPQVVVDLTNGQLVYIESIIQESIIFLENEMLRLGA